jgi:hypothetical protein
MVSQSWHSWWMVVFNIFFNIIHHWIHIRYYGVLTWNKYMMVGISPCKTKKHTLANGVKRG